MVFNVKGDRSMSMKRFLPLKPLWYQYAKLSERDKKVYHRLLQGLLNFEKMISLDGIAVPKDRTSVDVVSHVSRAIKADLPEIFYWDNSRIHYGDHVSVEPKYICSQDRAEMTLQAIDSKTSRFLATIRNLGDLQKVRRIHDFLATNCTYDDNKHEAAYRIDGAILDGLPVCNGFALTFKYMCDRVEVPCLWVLGDVKGSTSRHAWNIVWVGGKPYHVDVTFDAGMAAGKSTIRYDYFLLSDAEIRVDRAMDPTVPQPPCRMSYRYYDYMGLYFDRLDAIAPKIIAHAKACKPLQFQLPPRWEGRRTSTETVHELIKASLRKVNMGGSWSVWENKDHFVYYVEFRKK